MYYRQFAFTKNETFAVCCTIQERISLLKDVLDKTGYWAEGERECYVREINNLQSALDKLRS